MVVRKKGLYLGLLLSLLGIGNLVQAKNKAYKFLFVNNTSSAIKFVVQYHGSCENDFKMVHHKRIGEFKSNAQCEIKKFTVAVYNPGRRPTTTSTQLFAPGHFTRDKTIVFAIGEPRSVYKIHHRQISPDFEEEFISGFGRWRHRFELIFQEE